MRKFIILITVFLFVAKSNAQLVIIFQTPPSGITYKPQLWTMVLTNTSTAAINIHIEMTLTPVNSSQQILSGVTRTFSLPAGTSQINYTSVVPVQYNVSTNPYNVDANPFGLLPMGHFDACFHFFKHVSDNISQIAEQCEEIEIAPLSPPQLIYPYDQTAIEETHPQFSWLPPVPSQLFTNLNYDLRLVEINTNQSAPDAIQQNIPIYQATNISINALLYPLSATALEYEKHYAWHIVAKSNSAEVGASETWEFSLKHFGTITQTSPTEQPFVELRKDEQGSYAIFVNDIKFSYQNETSDSVWNIKIYDLSASPRAEGRIDIDSVPLKKGQNLVKYNARVNSFLINKHLYQLEILNSRNEIWRLRFEYRKPEQNN